MSNDTERVEAGQESGSFQSIVEAVSRTMNLPACVWVLDERSRTLRIKASVGLRPKYVREAFLTLDEQSVTGEAFTKGEVTSARDVLSDPRWKYGDEAREMGWKSVLCVPVRIQEAVQGVISIYTFVARDFSDLEKQLLTDYATQVGLALEAERRRKTLIHLLDIGQGFEQLITKGPKVVLQEIVRGACEVTAANCAVVYPYDAVREDFYDVDSVAHHGLQKPLELKDKPRKTGLGAFIVGEGELVRSDIEREDRDLLRSPFIRREGIQAFMGIALRIADQVLGILYVDFRNPHDFADEERDTIRLFAHQAALAIDNSRLYHQATIRAEALKKLHEVGPSLISAADELKGLKLVLTQIAQNAKTVLGADLIDLYEYVQSRDEYVLPPVQVGERYDPSVRKDEIHTDDVIRIIVESKSPKYFADAQQESTLIQPFTVARPDSPPVRFVVREEIQSTAAVPLTVGAEVVGVLFANYRSAQTFPQHQRELIELFASQAAVAIRNARLFEQRRTLQNIARDITRILDRDELLQKILEQSLNLLGCEIGSIALLNKSTNRLEAKYTIEKERYLSVPFGKGLIGTAAETRTPVRVEDVSEDKRYIEHVPQTQSELDVPMLIGNELVGVLNLESTRLGAFDRESEELAILLANQAAVALYNADLFARMQERLQQRLKDIKVFQQVYEAIHRAELQYVMRLVAEKATELTNAKYGGIWLVDRTGIGLEVGGLAGDERPPHELPVIPINKQSINGWVALTGQPYLCDDVTKDKHYLKWYKDTRSQLAVPLLYRDRVIGTLSVESVVLNGFSRDHQLLLEAMAGQAAVAIQNALLVRKLDVLYDVGSQLTSGIRLQEEKILVLIREQASKLMDTDNMYIALYDEVTDVVRFGLAFVGGRRVSLESEDGWQTRRAGKGRTEYIIHTKKPLFHPTIADGEQWYAEPGREEYVGGALPSWLGVPMIVGEKVLGVIATYHPVRESVYGQDDLAIMQILATQAAIALDNSRLYYRKNQQLEILIEIGKELTSGIHLEEAAILALIREQASKLMDTDNLYVALYDEPTDIVRFGLAFVDGKQADVTTDELWQPRKAGKGRTEEIIRTKKPIFSTTKEEAEAWYARPEHRDYWLGSGIVFPSWLGVPMMLGEKVLGVIATYHLAQEYAYRQDDLEMLQSMANQAAVALDNARLYHELSERAQELEGLQAVGIALTSESDLKKLLSQVTMKAVEVLEADIATVYLYDQTTGEFYLPVVVDSRTQPLPSKNGVVSRIAEEGELILADAPLDHPLLKDSTFIRERGVKSCAAVPLKFGGETVGILFINYVHEPRPLTPSDERAIRIFSDQAATAIYMAGLLYDAKRQLETVQEIVRAVEVHAKLPGFLDSILGLTLSKVEAQSGTIQLFDEVTKELVIRARAGNLAGRSHEYERIPVTKGITGKAARERQTAYVPDIKESDDYLTYIEGTRSEIAIPMMIGDAKLIGVLNIEHRSPYAFGPYSRGLLVRVAEQAAVLIQQKIEAEDLEERRVAAEVSVGLGNVTAEVAHHMKNLAGIIRVCTMRLQQQLSGLRPQQEDDLGILLLNAEGIMKAADDLFKPFRPEHEAEVSVALMLDEALSVLGEQPDIRTSVSPLPDLPKVFVQVRKVQSYILELLDNAIKFTRKGMEEKGIDHAQIEINGRLAEGNIVELAFTNHGPAIPRERWEAVFKLFSADEEEEGSKSQSYGLGLWGARTTMRMHGGDVCIVESDSTRTTFVMRLPAQRERR